MFSVHGVEYAAAIGPDAMTENSFPGQIRKKGLYYHQQNIFCERLSNFAYRNRL